MDDPEPTSLFLTFSLQTIPELYYITAGLISLLVLAFTASVSEAAILRLNKKELEKFQTNFPLEVEKISKIKKDSKLFSSSFLIFNSFINLSIVFILSDLSRKFPFAKSLGYTNTIIVLFIITLILLFLGKVIPRAYARKNPFKYSFKTLGFIMFIIKICYPFTFVFLKLLNYIDKRIKNEKLEIENLSQALEMATEDISTSDTEQKILEGIINFGSIETRQVMTPRIDVFALQQNLKFKDVIESIYKNGYSRIPIYNENIDDIKGILYSKDLIQYRNEENFNWNNLLKKPYFIPENKKIDDLLSDFKNRKMHLAIVVDEYGGTSGIVSLEDVIEEIVGDINDEFDDEEISYSKIDENIYVFEGKTPLIDFCKVMEVDEKYLEHIEGDADTLAGLVLEITEEFPKRLQKIYYKNLIFQVESLDRKRLKQIKVTRVINEQNN